LGISINIFDEPIFKSLPIPRSPTLSYNSADQLVSFYELKATKNNIGIGTFEDQLKIQILQQKAWE
jgi:hypothetical protein